MAHYRAAPFTRLSLSRINSTPPLAQGIVVSHRLPRSAGHDLGFASIGDHVISTPAAEHTLPYGDSETQQSRVYRRNFVGPGQQCMQANKRSMASSRSKTRKHSAVESSIEMVY